MSIANAGTNVIRKMLAAGCLVGIMIVAGCNSSPKYADSKDAVNNALKQNNLNNVETSQDRQKGVMTLTGSVPSQEAKTEAKEIAKTAAPTYTIANQIAVVPPAASQSAVEDANSEADDAIEAAFESQLKKHPGFKKDDISIESKNMSVTLSGTARTTHDKQQAEKIAKAIPNVQQVVNQIEVKR